MRFDSRWSVLTKAILPKGVSSILPGSLKSEARLQMYVIIYIYTYMHVPIGS